MSYIVFPNDILNIPNAYFCRGIGVLCVEKSKFPIFKSSQRSFKNYSISNLCNIAMFVITITIFFG